MTAERIAELNNLGFEWVVSRGECQPSTESTSSKHHQLNNNKHDPNKAPMCHDRSQEQQCHEQHQHGQKEMTSGVPCRASEEGGFAFLGVSEETSRNRSEELERRKDQPTPQHQHQPQHPSPQRVLPHPYQQYLKKSDDGSYLI